MVRRSSRCSRHSMTPVRISAGRCWLNDLVGSIDLNRPGRRGAAKIAHWRRCVKARGVACSTVAQRSAPRFDQGGGKRPSSSTAPPATSSAKPAKGRLSNTSVMLLSAIAAAATEQDAGARHGHSGALPGVAWEPPTNPSFPCV
jgi:hypothetical protein